MEFLRIIFRQCRFLYFASFLNVGGLVVAIAVFVLIILQLHFEWGYDKSYENSDRIFRVETLFPTSLQYSARTLAPIGELLKMQLAEVGDYLLVEDMGALVVWVRNDQDRENKFEVACSSVTASFLDILGVRILEGDGKRALGEPGRLMIPESMARKWFGKQSPVGKQLRIGEGEEYTLTIEAVYQDFPRNSIFKNVCYFSMSSDMNWGQWSKQLFILASTTDRKQLQKAMEQLTIEPLIQIYEGLHKEEQRRQEGKNYLQVTPLPEIYYDNQILYDTFDKGNQKYTYIMLGVGVLVIFVALVNFINFTLALAPVRMREVNIRKVVGAGNNQLKRHFVLETVWYMGVAYVLALLLLPLFVKSGVNRYFTVPVELSGHMGLFLVIGVGLLVLAGMVGYYPASYTTSFAPGMVLKGNFIHTPRGKAFRNSLFVFQFVISVVLIACTVLMVRQNHFLQQFSMGYATENIGWVKLDMGFNKNSGRILNEIERIPGVKDYTFSDFIPGSKMIGGFGNLVEGTTVELDVWHVYHNFLPFFEINLMRGDSISVYNQHAQVLFNENAVRLYPVLERYYGNEIPGLFGDSRFIGITGDINYLSLHKPVGALAMVYSPSNSYRVMFFKLAPGNPSAAILEIQQVFEQFAPESIFEFQFLDETIEQEYEYEQSLTQVVGILGGLAVFLALVGIYGMIIFQTQYRRKEIAIRKVNGATLTEIMILLNKGMIYQFLTGFLIACPVAYYIMIIWLNGFSYRTDIPVWIFLFAGGAVLLVLWITVARQSYRAARINPVKEVNNS